MPDSGSGTGTYVGPPVSTGVLYEPSDAISLPRYAEIVGIDECALFGIAYDGQHQYACRTIWTTAQRRQLQFYLSSAQAEIEDVVGYPLVPRWLVDDEQRYTHPLQTRWGYVIEMGVQSVTDLVDGTPVSHAADPAVVGPIVTTVTDASQLHVFFENTDDEIIPSSIVIAAGAATFYIPRCRMVIPSLESQQPKNGWDYTDTGPSGPFAQNVDIKIITTDASDQATLIRRPDCSGIPCTEEEDTACGYIQNYKTGAVQVTPATYSGGSFRSALNCYIYSKARLNYKAGLTSLPRVLEDAIIRLAHSRMPDEPCGCEFLRQVWGRDRSIPPVLTRERINAPFGLSEGAWTAWLIAKKYQLKRAGVL